MSLLDVQNLSVKFTTPDGLVHAVNDVSFSMERGDKIALVGESGSGKSQIAYAIMGLLAKNGLASGEVKFDGQNLLSIPLTQLNQIRGRRMAIIFQDPMSSLNPYMRIGRQLTEVLTQNIGISQEEADKRALEVLDAVRIPDAKTRLRQYPHEFSGGMRQRVMIAMALISKPDIILADEPTTALDVTVQAQIMALLAEIQQNMGTAILLITHDLGVVAGFCDKVMVAYAGRICEIADAKALFGRASHPYSQGLLASIPSIKDKQAVLPSIAGSPPNMLHRPVGCDFAPRCPYVMDICRKERPHLSTTNPQRACHLPQGAGL